MGDLVVWLRHFLPDWAISVALIAAAVALAWSLHALVMQAARWMLARKSEFWRNLLTRVRRPVRLALVLILVGRAAEVAPVNDPTTAFVQQATLVLFIVLVGWSVFIALDVASALYMKRFKIDVEDNLIARKHVTQLRILRRAIGTLVVLITAGLALMTIASVREWGVSLLAAGGAASIIVGLSLQPLLTNLIAGVQIAMTQPFRIDDAVIVEGEWGWIEEINATYVVIRLWDWRRLVVPLTYFISTPFQNWTRENAALIGTAMLYVGHNAPIDEMRAKLEDICKESKLWDKRVVNLAITDITAKTMEVRCLASARNAPITFDLRCEIREKMMRWLRETHPEALLYDRNLTEWVAQKDGRATPAALLAEALANRASSD
ncbi:MAG: mechanosensitive ion channel [Alphaproteobacteria bacterium]|nr:mechanosensitive ion channel [Alphaproteobacteria bacterium]